VVGPGRLVAAAPGTEEGPAGDQRGQG
jgi:hypothetical protein